MILFIIVPRWVTKNKFAGPDVGLVCAIGSVQNAPAGFAQGVLISGKKDLRTPMEISLFREAFLDFP